MRPSIKDRGIFSELAPKVRLFLPSWLKEGPYITLESSSGRTRFLLVGGVEVGFVISPIGPRVKLSHGKLPSDTDGDGIPDRLDFLIGGKKAVLNGAAYTEGYRRLSYPGGDMPRHKGVCTDVIIRALRNAGRDLQQLVHLDIRRRRRAYRMLRRIDPNIDHRRVRTILPFFKRHWFSLPAEREGHLVPLLPGDLLFLNTMGDARPDHIGIVSDRLGSSGYPLIINNWTIGHRTSEMDLLNFVPVTHRFRIKTRPWVVEPTHRGLNGLLKRRGLKLAAIHRQVLLVTTPLWSAARGVIRRLSRGLNGRWIEKGRPIPVLVGARGLGWGRGLHRNTTRRKEPTKQEGDRRAPAGIFALGTAFGQSSRPPYAPGRWPWRTVDAEDRLVDDPQSPHYNTWQRLPRDAKPSWRSAEKLSMYKLALLIKHNTDPVQRGAGSAIFLHETKNHNVPSIGCTMLKKHELIKILRWLDPSAAPVLVQLPGVFFENL